METTITLEFFSETHQHLESLEHQLKQIHGIQVLLVLPKDKFAPTLISLGIGKKSGYAEQAIQGIAQVLSTALRSTGEQSQKVILVTIEGEKIDITSLTVDAIERIITEAHANQ